jgi:hypothetical protein
MKKKAPFGTLYSVAEREGFEPSKSYPLHTFQACSFDRSDTSPGGNPDQPHLSTRLGCYRCSLPGLAEFTTVVARGPEWVTIAGAYPSELARRSVATVLYSFHESKKPTATVTWPLFPVIQLAMLTVAISGAFLLRNRSLKASYLELQAGLEATAIAVSAANARSSEGAGKRT